MKEIKAQNLCKKYKERLNNTKYVSGMQQYMFLCHSLLKILKH